MNFFDFNRDGKTDLIENALGFAILESLCEEEEDENSEDDESEQREEMLDQLRDELSDLEDELLAVELNEPEDVLSESYTRWESRRDLLEEQILCIEQELEELEWIV